MKNPYMWFAATGLVAWLGLVVGLGWLPRGRPEPPEPVSVVVVASHKVTEEMLEATRRFDGLPAPPFRGEDDAGRVQEGPIAGDRPTLLLFVKDGCPCSAAMQGYFNQIARAYAGEARILGVIDVGPSRARSWGRENRAAFPLLADPGLEIMRAYGATNSAFAALIDREGRVDMFWPGVSGPMLEILNGRIAALAGVGPRPIDFEDTPEELYSGCPYDL